MLILKNHLRFVSLSAAVEAPEGDAWEVSLALASQAVCLALGDEDSRGQGRTAPKTAGPQAACGVLPAAGPGFPLQRGPALLPSLAQTRPPPPPQARIPVQAGAPRAPRGELHERGLTEPALTARRRG